MSKYTTEVRYICEVAAGLTESVGYNSVDKVITKAIPKVFDFSFPIYDENYRTILERKILKHYYTREIAAETVGLWKLFLDRRLNEIMPYYNRLYESELFKFNPLYDVDLTTEHTRTGKEIGDNSENTQSSRDQNGSKNATVTNTGQSSQTANTQNTTAETGTIDDDGTRTNTQTLNTTNTATDSGTEGKTGSDVKKNTRWDIYSDTPQGGLSNVENESYLTNARKITDDGTGSTSSETTTFGKTTTSRDTGTVTDSETTANTRTLGTTTTTDGETETTSQSSDNTSSNERTTNTETATGTKAATHNINTTEDYIEHVSGKTSGGSYAKMILEYRDTLINIDTMIINELSDLFFNLW